MSPLRQAIEENTKVMRLLLDRLEKSDDNYINTVGAMKLLKVSNPRVMKPAREWGLLTKFTKRGREYYYDKAEVKLLADKVLSGQITLPRI